MNERGLCVEAYASDPKSGCLEEISVKIKGYREDKVGWWRVVSVTHGGGQIVIGLRSCSIGDAFGGDEEAKP